MRLVVKVSYLAQLFEEKWGLYYSCPVNVLGQAGIFIYNSNTLHSNHFILHTFVKDHHTIRLDNSIVSNGVMALHWLRNVDFLNFIYLNLYI